MDDSFAMRERVGRKTSLIDLLDRPESEAAHEAADASLRGESDWLPKPGDAYQAFARPSRKPELTLHILRKDGYFRGFAWASFEGIDTEPPATPGGGPVLVLRFAGLMAEEVRIEGRNLGVLHAYLGQNRVAWLRELPAGRDFREEGETVITGVTIQPWEPRPR